MDFDININSITVNREITKIDKSNAGNNGKVLENAFENVIQIPCVESTILTCLSLLTKGTKPLGGKYTFMPTFQGSSVSDIYKISINTDGSIEIQTMGYRVKFFSTCLRDFFIKF